MSFQCSSRIINDTKIFSDFQSVTIKFVVYKCLFINDFIKISARNSSSRLRTGNITIQLLLRQKYNIKFLREISFNKMINKFSKTKYVHSKAEFN